MGPPGFVFPNPIRLEKATAPKTTWVSEWRKNGEKRKKGAPKDGGVWMFWRLSCASLELRVHVLGSFLRKKKGFSLFVLPQPSAVTVVSRESSCETAMISSKGCA
jgi:hypothetical protein